MSETRTVMALVCLLYGVCLSGCAIRPSNSAGAMGATAGKAARLPTRELDPHVTVVEQPTPPPRELEKKGIRLVTVAEIGVRAGDPNGAPLPGRIQVEHLCRKDEVLEFTYAGPLRGSIKNYGYGQAAGSGQLRYYPPGYACEDKIEVAIRAADGCSTTVPLPIRVGPSRTASVAATAATAHDAGEQSAASGSTEGRYTGREAAFQALFQHSDAAIDSWNGDLEGAEAVSAAGFIVRVTNPVTVAVLDPRRQVRARITHWSGTPLKAACWAGEKLLLLYHTDPNQNRLLVYDVGRRRVTRELVLDGPFYHGVRPLGGGATGCKNAALLCRWPNPRGALVDLSRGTYRAGPLGHLPLPR